MASHYIILLMRYERVNNVQTLLLYISYGESNSGKIMCNEGKPNVLFVQIKCILWYVPFVVILRKTTVKHLNALGETFILYTSLKHNHSCNWRKDCISIGSGLWRCFIIKQWKNLKYSTGHFYIFLYNKNAVLRKLFQTTNIEIPNSHMKQTQSYVVLMFVV